MKETPVKTNPLVKYYELSGAEESFEDWVQKYKEVYVSKKRDVPFEDWLKAVIKKQQEQSNNEVRKLQAAGDINTEALKIKTKIAGFSGGWALLFLGAAFIGSIYLYKWYKKKNS